MAKYLKIGCVSLLITLMPVVASAESMCGDRSRIVDELGKTYQETGQARGLVSQVQLLEVFVSADKSWTILISRVDGVSCVVASGEGWQEQKQNISVSGAEI